MDIELTTPDAGGSYLRLSDGSLQRITDAPDTAPQTDITPEITPEEDQPV